MKHKKIHALDQKIKNCKRSLSGKKIFYTIRRLSQKGKVMASRKQIKAEIAEMENYFDELSEKIIDCKNEIENLKIEKEIAEGEIEIHESRIAYFDLLIRQLCEKFGAEGEAMFREMFPEEAEEILKK